jgi:hypothetical protein
MIWFIRLSEGTRFEITFAAGAVAETTNDSAFFSESEVLITATAMTATPLYVFLG